MNIHYTRVRVLGMEGGLEARKTHHHRANGPGWYILLRLLKVMLRRPCSSRQRTTPRWSWPGVSTEATSCTTGRPCKRPGACRSRLSKLARRIGCQQLQVQLQLLLSYRLRLQSHWPLRLPLQLPELAVEDEARLHQQLLLPKLEDEGADEEEVLLLLRLQLLQPQLVDGVLGEGELLS